MFSKVLYLLIYSACCLWQSGIAKKNEEIVAMSGKTIKLTCKTFGTTPTWFTPDPKNLINDSRLVISHRFVQLSGKRECISTLKLSSANIDDSGLYRCSTNKQQKKDRVRLVVKRFIVYVSDNATLITNTPHLINVREGEDLRLPCRATIKGISVRLKKSDAKEFNSNSSRVYYDATYGYIVRDVSLEDQGFWKCMAEYGSLRTERLMYVNVEPSAQKIKTIGRTSLRVIPSNRVLANQTVILRCEAECLFDTRPWITWNFTNGDEIRTFSPKNGIWSTNEKHNDQREPYLSPQSKYFISWSEVEVDQIQMSDAGTYSCRVQSGTGQVFTLAEKVDVVEHAFIFVTSSEKMTSRDKYAIQSIRGFPKQVEFTVSAFPPPEFYIFQNEKLLSRDWMELHLQKFENTNGTVVRIAFDKCHFDDAGDYTLLIRSKIQKREHNQLVTKERLPTKSVEFTLQVEEAVPPEIYEDEMWKKNEKSAIIGQGLKLSCSANGSPTPKILWYKDSILAENSSTFIILQASWNDTGNYTCTATNVVGSDSRSVYVKIRHASQKFKMGFSITVPICVFLIIAIGLALYVQRTRMQEIKRQMKIHMKYLAPILDLPRGEDGEILDEEAYDSKKWEIPRDRLKLGKTIGRGAFGRVVQATAYDIGQVSSCKTVAVKMLKPGCRNSEFQALTSELKILIHMGPHLNIVNLFGACTTAEGPLMIVVEYCRFGNLSKYLRSHRHNYIGRTRKKRILSKEYDNEIKQRDNKRSTTDEGEIVDATSVSGESAFVDCCDENRSHAKWNNATKRRSSTSTLSSNSNSESRDDDENCKTTTRLSYSCSVTSKDSIKNASRKEFEEEMEMKRNLTESDLLSYSYQVARGMEFLASRKCIHRDLAARNILIADNEVVKICDFGLARDVHRDPDYIRNGEARLPLKWMAIESIFDKVYSTKSDAWSFGILLWEIFSLGASPYPGNVMNEDFFNELKRGVRMQKPANAPDRVYESMLACWSENPDDRPTFTKLVEEFSDILQGECGDDYLDMLRIFEQNTEALLDRKIAPVRRPEETFLEAPLGSSGLQTEREYNAATKAPRETTPLITDSDENLHAIVVITSDDGSSLDRSELGSTPHSQRPSIDAGINSSANETPPSYNALMAV